MGLEQLVNSAYEVKVRNNRVIEIRPNRDESQTFILSGSSEEEVLNQLSLFMAIRQLSSAGNDFDFDAWRDKFEDGYPEFVSTSNPGEVYGLPFDNRPRVTILKREGVEYTVRLRPNREEIENYIFTGTKHEVRQAIIIFFNNWLIKSNSNDDRLNAYYPLDEYLRAKPRDYLSIQFWLTPAKEWSSASKPRNWSGYWRTYHFTVPDFKLPISWEQLVIAAGGSSGTTVGKISARAYLGRKIDNDSLKGATQLVVSSNSDTNAVSELRRIASYSKQEILKITVNEENYAKKSAPKPQAIKVYPAWCVILSSKLIDDTVGKGRSTLHGKHITETMRINLVKKPIYFEELMSKISGD